MIVDLERARTILNDSYDLMRSLPWYDEDRGLKHLYFPVDCSREWHEMFVVIRNGVFVCIAVAENSHFDVYYVDGSAADMFVRNLPTCWSAYEYDSSYDVNTDTSPIQVRYDIS